MMIMVKNEITTQYQVNQNNSNGFRTPELNGPAECLYLYAQSKKLYMKNTEKVADFVLALFYVNIMD